MLVKGANGYHLFISHLTLNYSKTYRDSLGLFSVQRSIFSKKTGQVDWNESSLTLVLQEYPRTMQRAEQISLTH